MGTKCGVKITSTFGAGGDAQHLLDLGRMAVSADVIGRDALVAFGIMRRQLRVRPAPETPLFESIMIIRGSISPAFNSGAKAKMADVG